MREKLERILNQLPQHLCVRFALYCCNDIRELITHPDSIKAIETTRQWLEVGDVSQEEIDTASSASSASAAASTASTAAYAAVYTAASAYAASASYASSASIRKEKEGKYYQYLLTIIHELSELERLIWDVNNIEGL